MGMKKLLLLILLASSLWASKESEIKDYLKLAYEKHYLDYHISIANISLNIPSNLQNKDYQIQSIELDSKNLNKKNATLILNVLMNQSLLKIPLEYVIEASIEVYRANSGIKKYENITHLNTTKTQIPLERMNQIPIKANQINETSAKSYIAPNSIITLDKIQPKILIHKNDSFIGVIQNKHINLEMTLIAKENGSKGQIINAINPETKKIIRVKIINEDKGEVL